MAKRMGDRDRRCAEGHRLALDARLVDRLVDYIVDRKLVLRASDAAACDLGETTVAPRPGTSASSIRGEQVSTQNDIIFLDCVVVALIHCIGHRLTTVTAYVRSSIDV